MHPILLQLGPITLRTYGALVVLAFLAALRVARSAAPLRGVQEGFLLDLVAILIITGLLGARLFYVFLNASYFLVHPLEIVKIWEGGLVFYGGFFTAAVAGVLFSSRRHVRVGKVADCLAPALALGQAIGRLGCFFAGCCYGKPTALPWAVMFKDPASLAPLSIDLHPTQIYESLGDLIIATILWIQLVRRPHSKGEIFWLYVLLYGILRFAVEFLRGDDRGPTVGGLYPSQLISLVAVLVAGSVIIAKETTKNDAHA
jgi:phosphatidylglycerol:prolipoprotein diacylglycerol transferase